MIGNILEELKEIKKVDISDKAIETYAQSIGGGGFFSFRCK